MNLWPSILTVYSLSLANSARTSHFWGGLTFTEHFFDPIVMGPRDIYKTSGQQSCVQDVINNLISVALIEITQC